MSQPGISVPFLVKNKVLVFRVPFQDRASFCLAFIITLQISRTNLFAIIFIIFIIFIASFISVKTMYYELIFMRQNDSFICIRNFSTDLKRNIVTNNIRNILSLKNFNYKNRNLFALTTELDCQRAGHCLQQ